jgi:hypothetical protein
MLAHYKPKVRARAIEQTHAESNESAKIFLVSTPCRENYLNENWLVAVALLDANCTVALATAVLFGVTDGFRASIPGTPTAAVLADEPPLGCSEAFAVP